ncbi:MAG: hypothetical protein ABW178_01710 [Pseudoxanthomonas sp.]
MAPSPRGIAYAELEARASALPHVARGTSYGTPALKVRTTLMARLKEDGLTLVLRASWEDRERLMVLQPKIYFLTDHYRGHLYVLVNLDRMAASDIDGALRMAWWEAASPALRKQHPELTR